MTNIKNVIFDLGGVIIDLDPQATIRAFNGLVEGLAFDKIYSQAQQTDLFDQLDKGLIQPNVFFNALADLIGFKGEQQLLEAAWNAMLLKVPSRRLDLLIDLKPRYRTFLLSNTCEPHIDYFERELYEDHGVRNFEDYFEKVYYSCRMGIRKPQIEIFERVLNDNGLIASETLFIDDSIQHIEGAKKCGIQACWLEKGREVSHLIRDWGLL